MEKGKKTTDSSDDEEDKKPSAQDLLEKFYPGSLIVKPELDKEKEKEKDDDYDDDDVMSPGTSIRRRSDCPAPLPTRQLQKSRKIKNFKLDTSIPMPAASFNPSSSTIRIQKEVNPRHLIVKI